MKAFERIYVALDTTDVSYAVELAQKLKGLVGGMKVGKEFFTANGPQGVAAIRDVGMPVFLDLKFHDIPNTVAGAIRAAKPIAPQIINVHAQGGPEMLKQAANAGREAGIPLTIAVTILTALDQDDLDAIGINDTIEDQVVRLAKLTQDNGLDGVVCSAKEIAPIRAACGPDFKLIVPGIRPAWAAKGDQKRVMTPRDAVLAGADILVIGRPITQADDPVEAAQKIAHELEGL
ncbi:orotidine 5'-phosphate decarboxylase [Terasakiella brassicae]|uniref:Orotidine 5'-phosphate decarboxylase n=1 Tax=Terasakiella brassicae TaxID=1634917 RepID=A0A917BXQ6_9PROT|nr:orotidine-5'-phosphate decarboxylase [Terasakiella brassicae]GGF62303.1 orotidine 5'-phosphate decarboxylase [Terasakiella brassicae]